MKNNKYKRNSEASLSTSATTRPVCSIVILRQQCESMTSNEKNDFFLDKYCFGLNLT